MRPPGLDPISVDLVGHALGAIVDEMALTIVRTAHSSNLKNSMDLSSALCDAKGRLVVQGLTLQLHLGSIPDCMAAIQRRFGAEHRPGDVYIFNDPYDGGTHLPDIYMVQPVFVAGRLLGYAATIAHHTDIGGKVAGGNGCDATEIYQEGLRIPPTRLFDAGRRNPWLEELIARNVRIPDQVLGDLRAQLAACHIGHEGLLSLAAQYGAGALEVFFEELLDRTERLARDEIRRMPDGVYRFTDYIDDDGIDPGPIPIKLTLTIEGDALTADFTGTAAQVKGGINSPISFTKSTVYACARCMMGADVPNNAGYFRPITVIAPEGSIVNPLPPAAVAARGLTAFRIANTVFGALAQALPDKVPACEMGGDTGVSIGGYYPDGRAFVFLEFLHGSWGGRPFADGIDGVASTFVNFSNNPVEMIEAELPLRIERFGFLPDTGGPGKYRGGLALVREYRFIEERGVLQLRTDRYDHLPYGLAGGRTGTPSKNVLIRDGKARRIGGKVTVQLRRGDLYRHEVAGAGGHGHPFERDAEAVLGDVLDGKMTRAHARRAYGVVITAGTLRVDEAATQRERASQAGAGR